MSVLAGEGREGVFCSVRSNDPGIKYLLYITDMYSTMVPSPVHCYCSQPCLRP